MAVKMGFEGFEEREQLGELTCMSSMPIREKSRKRRRRLHDAFATDDMLGVYPAFACSGDAKHEIGAVAVCP